jgi:Domain of unknown function (DUF222)
MAHLVLDAVRAVDEALKAVADVNPTFMTTADKADALRALSRADARLAELRLRVLADADDVAVHDGAGDAAEWLASQTHQRVQDTRADLALGIALDRRRPVLAQALRDGEANVAQAHVIARVLDALPADVPADVVDRAEAALVDHAGSFGPRALARLGRRVLDVVAPELAEAEEARRLADLEADGADRVRFAMRRVGDGTTSVGGRLPDAVAERLATYLEACTSPRRAGCERDPLRRLPYPRRLGQALCAFLEHIDPSRLPLHGGDATTVVVTVPLDALRRELGAADVLGSPAVPGDSPTDGGLSATEVRRLACTAQIVPAVLGGRSEVLDLGRSRRLFSPAQRKALLLRDRRCRAEGCEVSGTWAEAHHWDAWSTGGRTDLHDGVLLCHPHHQRVHDSRFTAERLPNGDVRFHRRS